MQLYFMCLNKYISYLISYLIKIGFLNTPGEAIYQQISSNPWSPHLS